MTDDELTKLAAEAFGNPPAGFSPLTDDGDALRLAVKLEIRIDWGAFDVVAIEFDADAVAREPKGTDPYAATRRAIVRAAAALAESEQGETP